MANGKIGAQIAVASTPTRVRLLVQKSGDNEGGAGRREEDIKCFTGRAEMPCDI